MAVSLGTGLSSGIDYTTMVSQLMQIEARPQTLLRIQLATAQADGTAYRDVNGSFAALAGAAKAVQDPASWTATKAVSSSGNVSVSSTAAAQAGSNLTFSVTALASAQTSVANGTWTSATAPVRDQLPDWPIKVLDAGKNVVGSIDVPADATLSDAAAAINKSGYGLSATVVKLADNQFKLQVTSSKTGTKGEFTLQTATEDATAAGSSFTVSRTAQDATLDLGNGMVASSATNTFADLLTGVSVTVSELTTAPTTITVSKDPGAATKAVESLVTAANQLLAKISTTTDSSTGSKAVLKGDYSLTSLASQVLTAVSSAVGVDGTDNSAAVVGLQLTRDGKLTFNSSVFAAKLASDPALTQRIFGGKLDVGSDNVAGTVDDVVATDGLGARLQRLAQLASDSVNGSLTALAKGQDSRATDLQKQIDNWDVRLTQRRASLTAQFNALEKTLGTLQNQASWLSSQLASLPSWSKSNSS